MQQGKPKNTDIDSQNMAKELEVKTVKKMTLYQQGVGTTNLGKRKSGFVCSTPKYMFVTSVSNKQKQSRYKPGQVLRVPEG